MATYSDNSGSNPVKHNYVTVNDASSSGTLLYTCPANVTAYVTYFAANVDNLQIRRNTVNSGESLATATATIIGAPGANRAFVWNPYASTPAQFNGVPTSADPHSTTHSTTPGQGQDDMAVLFPGDEVVKNTSGARIYLKILEIGML